MSRGLFLVCYPNSLVPFNLLFISCDHMFFFPLSILIDWTTYKFQMLTISQHIWHVVNNTSNEVISEFHQKHFWNKCQTPVHIECYLYVFWSTVSCSGMKHVEFCILISSVQNHKLIKHTKLLSFEWNCNHFFFMSDSLCSRKFVCVCVCICLKKLHIPIKRKSNG